MEWIHDKAASEDAGGVDSFPERFGDVVRGNAPSVGGQEVGPGIPHKPVFAGLYRLVGSIGLFALICGREKRRVFSLWWVADTRDGSGQCVAGVPVFQGVPKANRDRTKLKENEGGPCQV